MNRPGRLAAGFVFAALCAGAQTNVAWQTTDGGGGTSTGGAFALEGTVGHPDGSEAMHSGVYDVQGGFWALVELVQTEGAPRLRIADISSVAVTLAWPVAGAEGYQLQRASRLAEPDWTPVSGTPSVVGDEYQLTTGPVVVKHYYRLQKP
jgi:hypothetical protein